jgi:uncharacterized protein
VLERTPEGGGHLLASRCGECGAHYFPQRRVCARCLSETLERVPLSTRGTIYTCTVVHQSTPEFPVPYVLAYVDLPEGVRVPGQVAGCDPAQVHLGMSVDLAVEPLGEREEGRAPVSYRFQPAVEGGR